MKKTNNKKGITLIALVVTIVVMLILAAVAIAQITGNGLIKTTNQAKSKDQQQEATELMNIKITSIQISHYQEKRELPTLQYLADKLCEDEDIEYVHLESQETASVNEKVDVGNYENIYTKLAKYPFEFGIDKDLRLASVDGIKVAGTNAEAIEELRQKIEELEASTARQSVTDSLFTVSYSIGESNYGAGTRYMSSFTGNMSRASQFDTYFSYDTTNNRLVCKKAGNYILNFSARGMRRSDGGLYGAHIINGKSISWRDSWGNGSNSEIETGKMLTIYLNVNDTVNFSLTNGGTLWHVGLTYTVHAN